MIMNNVMAGMLRKA